MEPTKTRLALIGFGYWGPNLLRNALGLANVEMVGVVDPNPSARERCGNQFGHIPTFASIDELLERHRIDGAIIATPPHTHCELALKALAGGAHVLVEKPLATSSEECAKILAFAKPRGLQVMVDHTFLFHPAVEYLTRTIEAGGLGDLLYYDSVRVNLGGFQPRTNVLWDLAPHDLSILDQILNGRLPTEIACIGIRHFKAPVENLCHLTLRYENDFVAHMNLNWVAPVKIRTITIGGTKQMAIYDDNLPTEKVKVYDKSVTLTTTGSADFRVNYRTGDMYAPAISTREALSGMMAQFVECVRTGQTPKCDGASGQRMVRILEAASVSISEGGRPVTIDGSRIERTGILRVA